MSCPSRTAALCHYAAVLLLFLSSPACTFSLAATGYVKLNSIDQAPSLDSRDAVKPFALRTMPLGASITWGYKSPDGNGYREQLRNNMTAAGWEVNMVGSMHHGTMQDDDNEGHVGFRVDQIAEKAELTIPQKPNLILINAGTNDALQHHNVSTTGERMDQLLDRLYEAIPNTTVVLSTLLPNKRVPISAANISAQYRDIVDRRQKANQRIVLADMSQGGNALSKSELVDNTHPNEAGYTKMAEIWWGAIQEAESKGYLSAPANVDNVNDANGGKTSSDDKLTEAGKITIGIVVPFGVITVGVLSFLFYRRWQRRKERKGETNSVLS
ncbi:SGNH hydrolase-type esterase domain-containing protein [Talaromyces proteolyticus]|uniref:SGNH hydrolase-type esterase domain-containing protein n=1 Tax=Talaromyces proteolyticus TaxID=1131652 RepID=A0AAD4KW23_9EURO|nr:SGNH hydrolase-type esterase domain-containing protein [Talaromyces proteolyticus]KAH8697956.1 SGNH hydrolase-type esterase domain-containing protein [Talaromyces proteolyticus]